MAFSSYVLLGKIKGASNSGTTLTSQDLANIRDVVWEKNIEAGLEAQQLMRLFASALGGEASGLQELAPIYKSLSGSKNRITATTDEFGNRTSITLDLT